MVANRRDFLKGAFALGIVGASPKIIFDYGARLYKLEPVQPMIVEYHPDAYQAIITQMSEQILFEINQSIISKIKLGKYS